MIALARGRSLAPEYGREVTPTSSEKVELRRQTWPRQGLMLVSKARR